MLSRGIEVLPDEASQALVRSRGGHPEGEGKKEKGEANANLCLLHPLQLPLPLPLTKLLKLHTTEAKPVDVNPGRSRCSSGHDCNLTRFRSPPNSLWPCLRCFYRYRILLTCRQETYYRNLLHTVRVGNGVGNGSWIHRTAE